MSQVCQALALSKQTQIFALMELTFEGRGAAIMLWLFGEERI